MNIQVWSPFFFEKFIWHCTDSLYLHLTC
jgi:hypothetical protein